jgi:hypothetical protein
LETDSRKDIVVAGKVEDIIVANTVEDVAAADTAACSISINIEEVVADSIRDVLLFERISEEPLLPELEAGNIKESVVLSESTLLMLFNLSCITCFLLSTGVSDILPQLVKERLLGLFGYTCSILDLVLKEDRIRVIVCQGIKGNIEK